MSPPGPALPRLRPAVDDDNRDVIGLIGACWSEYAGCVMDVHGECPDLLTPASAYQRQGGAFWVGVDRCGTVVATVGWRPFGPDTYELERLYVHHRWRRQGVAAGLADMVEQAAADRGATEIELWSDSRFADAHRFYLRRGYTRVGADRELGDLSRTREHHFVKVL